jgi:hypothetical protein
VSWTSEELTRIGDADELQITSVRKDGTLRPYVTIWMVRSGDDLYVRSARRPAGGWFRHALSSGTGRIRAAGVERDVSFEIADPPGLDEAYHAKYDKYPAAYVDPVVGPAAAGVTLRLVAG